MIAVKYFSFRKFNCPRSALDSRRFSIDVVLLLPGPADHCNSSLLLPVFLFSFRYPMAAGTAWFPRLRFEPRWAGLLTTQSSLESQKRGGSTSVLGLPQKT